MNNWKDFFETEKNKGYYINLMDRVNREYQEHEILPPYDEIFNAFKYTKLKDVKVVILGQDPYHNKGQSHGLAFSVRETVKIPASLRNIFKELEDDIACYIPNNGYLKKWAEQGVLLLNSILTVRENDPRSHKNIGWEVLTSNIIKELDNQDRPIVFILWGKDARENKSIIKNKRHYILEAVHPSPLSAYGGFFGCKHFSKTNTFLKNNNISKIDWQIENI